MAIRGISKLRLNKTHFENAVTDIEIGNVTVIVGPNNSGKSQMLIDIDNWLVSPEYRMKLLESIDLDFPTEDSEVESLLNPYEFDRRTDPDGDIKINIRRADFRNNSSPYDSWINLRQFQQAARDRNASYFKSEFTKFYSILLGGRQRFNIISPGAIGNTTQQGGNFLAVLYRNDNARQNIRDFVHSQFGTYLYFSPHDGANLNLVLNETPDLDETSLRKHTSILANSPSIYNYGDGIQCFVGLLIASYCYPFKILLIDEPEAYLHPPTSAILAAQLSKLAIQNKSSLIVATHSPDFVIGCLEAAHHNLTIIRLTYNGKIGSARLLDAENVKKFYTDPLLRTTETLNSLFHNSAVVCEADSDKVFYSEINRRLLPTQEGILDTIFLNAQNKQTIHRIAAPLRKVGIPTACIFDIDVMNKESLKNEDTSLWEKILSSLFIPTDIIESLENDRSQLEQNMRIYLDSNSIPYKKPFSNLQTQSLPFGLKEEIQSLLAKVKKFGIFIVPVGQLEDWLLDLSIPNITGIWLVDVLQFMEDTKLQPRNDNVWEFVREINKWIMNPLRLGMPT